MQSQLSEYFRENAKNGIIDFSLRAFVQQNGIITFYIHPDGKDGETLDYEVNGNDLVPMK